MQKTKPTTTMTKLFFFTLSATLLFINADCKKEPPIVIPPTPTNCEYPPGNRNFTWRLDTVAWWPSTLGGVHAFSDSDAYLMGYIGEGKAPWRIFVGKYWDGTQWTTNINGTDAEVGHVANDVTGDDHFMVSVGNWSITPSKPAIGEFDNQTKKWKSYQFQTKGELRSVWTDGKGYFIAVGDNGMVYTKDGYTAEWVYSKAPTEFNLGEIRGVSKKEMYVLADTAVPGNHFQQVWRILEGNWIKLFDNHDSLKTTIHLPDINIEVLSLSVARCAVSDSLYLYLYGDESFLITAKGYNSPNSITNFEKLGLPLSLIQKPAISSTLFSVNDIWISSWQYNLFHWNGSNFKKIESIGKLPYGEMLGIIRQIKKTSSGKIWMVLQMQPQIYAIIQGEK